MKLNRTYRSFRRYAILAGLAALATPVHAQNNWVGPANGFWETSSNWSLGLPGAGQTLNVGVNSGLVSGIYTSQTLNYSAGTWTVGGGSLNLTGGTTNQINQLVWTGGTLGGAALLQVNNGATISGGRLNTGSTMRVNGPATFNSSGFLLGANSTLKFFGTTSMSGSVFMGSNAAIELNNSASLSSTFTATGGEVRVFTDASSNGNNANIGSFFVIGSESTYDNGSATLSLSGGGTLNGSIFGSGGTVNFVAGTFNQSSLTGVTGQNLTFGSGASFTTSGAVSAETASIGGLFKMQPSATWASSDSISIESAGTMEINGTTGDVETDDLLLRGVLDTDRVVKVQQNFAWESGTIKGSGEVRLEGNSFLLSSGIKEITGATVINNGQVQHEDGQLKFTLPAGTFKNNGTYEIFGTDVDIVGSSANQIKNFGTFRKTASSTDVTDVFVKFDNPAGGIVDVQGGSLKLMGGGTGAGIFNVAPGANIDFNLGLYTFSPGASFSGEQVITDGEVTIGNGVVWTGKTTINGGFLAYQNGATFGSGQLGVNGNGKLKVQSGLLDQTGPFSNWNGGNQSLNSGNFIISSDSQFKFANSGIETNNSNIWLLGDGAEIKTSSGGNALFTLSNNNGILSLGSLLMDLGVNLEVQDDLGNSGTLAVDSGSSIDIGGRYRQFSGQTIINGSLQAAGGVLIDGGEFGGNGTVDGGVNNGGSLSPGSSPGTMTINGNFVQQTIGNLNMEIQSQSVYDKLVVNGTGVLNGRLNVRFLQGYNPQLGQIFDLLTFSGGYTGQFSQITTIGNNSFYMDVSYSNPNVVRGTLRAVPEPATMLALGGALVGLGLRRRKKNAS